MGREKAPGWLYPDLETTGQADAREAVLSATSCPVCGALVPEAAADKHFRWHTTPSGTPVPKG
ncbi:hypothetical protein SEA_BOLT007_23 [Arthrobacter phage Bolt007]|uniref:Uncharacterized protein n=1 Tax=Arthrobacter phage Bolt007 TaxID=3017297 RepID=A0AA49E540_9CAUD|nr:hypothetical protein SEA_BOLT007_23 [Arthrobacter phage Bolt007]